MNTIRMLSVLVAFMAWLSTSSVLAEVKVPVESVAVSSSAVESDSDKSSDKSSDKASDKATDKASDKASDKATDKDSDGTEESKESSKEEQAEPKEKPRLREIRLSGEYVDLVQPLSFDTTSLLLGQSPMKQRSFYRLCKFIDDLSEDDRFEYVVLNLSDSQLAMNGAQLDELSRYLKRLSDSGKRTYAWLENADNVHLSIAASCDEVLLADFGGIDMPSMAIQAMFYRDAMDLLGVKASVVRAGDFKGAVEPYTNPAMSDHLREHYLKMLESMNEATVDRIARGRGQKHAAVRDLQKKRILLPAEALQAGLVDQLAPYGGMREAITDHIGEEVDWVTPKEATKKQMSLFQLMGQIMSGSESSAGRLRDNSLCVLHLQGAIMDGTKASTGNIVSGPTVELIDKLTAEKKVAGVVVRINSPGGSATASEAIRQALVRLAKAKPVVVSMGDVAASGGYWISCIDAPVYAERSTMTGSIGVFSMKLSAGALMRRVGVHVESITLDESAGLFSLDRSWNDEDTTTLQGTIDMVYDRFLDLVSESRHIKQKKLSNLAGGRVWSGDQSKRNKLIDQIGGVDDALAAVAKQASLDQFKVIHRPIPRLGLDLSELLGSSGEEEIWSGLSRNAARLLQQRGFSLKLTSLLLQRGLTEQGKPTVWLLNPIEISVR